MLVNCLFALNLLFGVNKGDFGQKNSKITKLVHYLGAGALDMERIKDLGQTR